MMLLDRMAFQAEHFKRNSNFDFNTQHSFPKTRALSGRYYVIKYVTTIIHAKQTEKSSRAVGPLSYVATFNLQHLYRLRGR